MTEITDSKQIKKIVLNTTVPLVIKGVCKWPMLEWPLEVWETNLKSRELPFRCKPTGPQSKNPDWERNCPIKNMKMEDFVKASFEDTDDWFYFDYKYMHKWFKPADEIFKQISWDSFGYPKKTAADSTLWIGSNGAHTPCHQDTYGINIVVQVFGRKQWILFPPETGGMKPTRIPYEESSIYSKLNFSSPSDLKMFDGLHGVRMVTLEKGDVLVVPPKWWHYVENVSPIAISINLWILCPKNDFEAKLEEALIRFLITQFCKDMEPEQFKSILNPNEEYLVEMPLDLSLLQTKSAVSDYIDYNERKKQRKRVKNDLATSSTDNLKDTTNVDSLILNPCSVHEVKQATADEFKNFLAKNMKKNKNTNPEEHSDETENVLNHDNLNTAIIESFCDSSVIKLVREILIKKFT